MSNYSELNKINCDDAGEILAKQFLRSGINIRANCAEAIYAQSKKILFLNILLL